MTSGKPFSRPELEFIWSNMNEKFPSVVARAISIVFCKYNGGYRSREAVAAIMRRFQNGESINDILKNTHNLEDGEEHSVVSEPEHELPARRGRKKKIQ